MLQGGQPDETLSLADVIYADVRLSARLAVQDALRRAKAAAHLNAFVTVDEDYALAAASASDNTAASEVPLRGVVLAIKDNIHVRGLPNTAGTPSLRSFMPPDTSPVVMRLQQLGAVVLGKTGLHELAYGVTSNNAAFGAVRNPLDTDRIAGGSSGGTAAAVAAGIVTAGIGTDTGGSVRLPAALTGTVGFRPTTGVYSTNAITLISSTRDTLGLMTRTVKDAALMHAYIVNEPVAEPVRIAGLRIGVPRRHFRELLDPEVEDVFAALLAKLAEAGAVLVEADLDEVPELTEQIGSSVCLHETARLLPDYLARYGAGTVEQLIANLASPDVAAVVRAAVGGAVPQAAYDKAIAETRPALQRAFTHYFARHKVDAVVFPTSPITARLIDGIDDGVLVRGDRHDTFSTYIRNVDPASNAGMPALSLPAGATSEGLTVGAEFECLAGEDRKLLAIALGVEGVLNAASNVPISHRQQSRVSAGKGG